MNPDHLKLAVDECSQLLSQELIEATTSSWTCETFYVNKRLEQVHGKLRLVINYKPLNQFLVDDKFPLPRRKVLFANLAQAKIFSKFDLKAGFWHLEIHPLERYKTAFCIPQHHYQWTVMSFSLKTAPSLFQKAMTKIFSPIMENALIYINDILLFSPDETSHKNLLERFHQIVQQYEIMLAGKKMTIVTTEVDFLGLHLKDGQYVAQPHISQKLHNFPDSHLTRKQIQ